MVNHTETQQNQDVFSLMHRYLIMHITAANTHTHSAEISRHSHKHYGDAVYSLTHTRKHSEICLNVWYNSVRLNSNPPTTNLT